MSFPASNVYGLQGCTISGVCVSVGCLTSQQYATVSQGRICSDNFMCCHTEIEVADQTLYLTQSQYPNTGLTSPSADPTTPGAWQGSHWSAKFWITGMTRPWKNPGASSSFEPRIFHSWGRYPTTRSTRQSISRALTTAITWPMDQEKQK